MEKIEQEVFDELKALGSQPYEIADCLHTLGIKGAKGSACYCPIAEYVKRNHPEFTYVSSFGSTSFEKKTLGLVRRFVVPYMGDVFRFQQLFDEGLFPQLDANCVSE